MPLEHREASMCVLLLPLHAVEREGSYFNRAPLENTARW